MDKIKKEIIDMSTLSIRSNRVTQLIIENYYLIVFLVYFGSIYFPFIRTGVTMTIALLYLLLNSRICKNGNNNSYLLFIFAIYCVLSIIGYSYNGISIEPYFAEFSNQLLPMILFFIPIGAVDREKFYNKTVWGISLSLIVGLYFWYESPDYYIEFVKKIADNEYDQKINTLGLRFQSIYGSIITGTLCIYLVILSSYKLFYTNNLRIERILYTFFLLIGLCCGIMTQQRSAMVLIISLIVVPFTLNFYYKAKIKKFYTILIIVLVTIFIFYISTAIPDYIDRYIYRLNEIETGLSDRNDQWKIALSHNPNFITGLGLGSSGHKAQGYYEYLVFDGAYWKIINEVGIVGFLLFILPILSILRKRIKYFLQLYREYMFVLCVMIQSLASNTMCFMLTLPMFWFGLRTINQKDI